MTPIQLGMTIAVLAGPIATAQESSRDLWTNTAESARAQSPDSDSPCFATPLAWDGLSAEILPRFFAADGATAVMATVAEAGCFIDVSVTPSAGPPTEGSLDYAWKDADNNGILTAGEVRTEIARGDAKLLEPYRKQFETQSLAAAPRILLRSSVQTEKRGDGYIVRTTGGPRSDALELMGLAEMTCTLSPDLKLVALTTKSTSGLETFARIHSKKLNGSWFPTQSIRRLGIPGKGMFLEKTDIQYASVDGVPVQKRMIVESEALAPNGETTAIVRQIFAFRDWHLVKRPQPLNPPHAPAPKFDEIAMAPSPAPEKVAAKRTAVAHAAHSSTPLASPGRLPIEGVEKYVSPQARFALYKPIGWRVNESVDAGRLNIAVTDPTGRYIAQIIYGSSPAADPISLARACIQRPGPRQTDVELAGAYRSPDGRSLVFDSLAGDPARGGTKCRNWVSMAGDAFTVLRCQSPAAEFEQSRRVLLTILMNVQIMQNTIPAAPRILPLSDFRLSDGSASFSLPLGWMLEHDWGVGHFSAKDPSGLCSLTVASIEIITPQLGVRVPGVPILPYLPPHSALASLAEFQGILRDVRFVEVIPRTDIASMISQVYTVGPVEAEECISTYVRSGTRCKGYTFGVSLGARLGTNWRFNHMSVGAPAADFDSLVPTLATIMGSYRINDQFAMQYIANGLARLRQMQQETAAIIAKNRQEISSMMQAAYDERQRSQDWIDYQRSNYILGRSDWISGMEGGAVYHTDSWGTQNTITGERWDGSPFNYVNFEGENPKYNELMTPIDNRRLYEQVFRTQ